MYRNSNARQRVLGRLKERGSATVEELARDLDVVPVTMRTHLAALAGQGLVEAQTERGRVGRPRQRFSLTRQADSLYPNRYAAFAGDLLDSLRALAGARGIEQLLDVTAARQAAENAGHVHGRTLAERVPLVAEVLCAESGLADWSEETDRFVIRDRHCPYGDLARSRPEICHYHTQVVTRLLGEPVSLDRAIARGDHYCHFSVARGPAQRAAAVHRLSDGRAGPEPSPRP
jgi:predicted ArsR family transcriptional regulator